MKRHLPVSLFTFAIFLFSSTVSSQVATTPNNSAAALVNNLVGTGVIIVSSSLTCANGGSGTFTTTGACNMGLGTGVILTSGNVANANGPNTVGSSGVDNAGGGYPLLDPLAGAATQDACYLTFSFIPITNSISFNYVFGSEEYPEFVSSGYNDAFGFFLTGPGGYSNTNIATLPIGGNPPVTIDNVNASTNPGFYINNLGGTCVQYDGMTTTLTASAAVIPCSTYTITIAIADAGDGSYDSGVFFQENSFSAGSFLVNITSQTNATCAALGSATAAASGGTPPYTYSWSTTPVQNTATATNLAPGTYTVTASYNVCGQTVTATNTVTITGPALTTANITAQTNVSCFGGNDGSLTAAGGGNPGPYGFSWAPSGGTGATASGLSAGTYTVTVTSANGCTGTTSATITQPPVFVPTATNTGPYCAGQTIQLNSPSGTAADDWTGPGGYTANNTQNPTRPSSTTAMAGVYTVNVTNAAGCTGTATTSVVVNALPVPTATNGGPYCVGQTIQLNSPTGSATDDWAGPGVYTAVNTQNPTRPGATAGMAGTYTVTVTDGAGCSATATTSVTVNALPIPTANNTGPYCAGATIQLNSPTGSATDDWAGPGGYTSTNTQNPSIGSSTALMSGVYTVTVTNGSGCSATATTTVTVNPLPTPTANNTGPYCSGATIQLNSPTGSATDDWAGPGGYTSTNTQNPTIAGATAAMSGVYTVTVTSAAGCSATATTTVTVNLPAVAVANNTGPYCAGQTIQLNSPAGSATDDWTGPGGYSAVNTQNPTRPLATAAMAGVYTVTVTMAGGCSATGTTTVVVNPLPTPTANNTGPYCAGATIQLNSPTGSATDDWAGPGGYTSTNTQNPSIGSSTALMSGVYTVTVTNGSGCSATATTTVTVNALPTPTANNTGPYCVGATIQLNSPTGSATDDWSGPGGYTSTNTQNPSIAGSTLGMTGVYTVSVTNASGCTATATTSVVINALPTPFANNTGPYCDGENMDLSSGGGVDYDWSGPAGFVLNNTQNGSIPNANPVMSGTYTVSVTDANGCNATATTAVTINSLPTPFANNTGPYCNGENMDLSSGGGVDYDWSGPAGFVLNNTQNGSIPNANPGMSGTYTVNVTDANGCNSITTTVVTINASPNAVAGNTGPVCEGINAGLTSNGGTAYAWQGPLGYNSALQNPTIPTANPSQTGNYTVTVTDANNCSSTATTFLTVNALPLILANSNAPQCDGDNVTLNGNGAFNYTWVGPNGFNQNGQSPVINNISIADNGVYTVTGTDANNCSATATVNVISWPLPTSSFVGDNLTGCAPLCVNFTDQSNGNGGVINTWNWNIQGQAPVNTQNAAVCFPNAGTYDATLTVTTADGCVGTLTLTNYITVNANPIASFDFTPEEIDIDDPLVTFASTSTGASSWSWMFGDGGTSTLEKPNHMYQDTGIYCVLLTVANSAGCTDTTTGCLYIEPMFNLYVPNAFTPNEDGLNETFNVYGTGIKTISVRIFDRWGEELYFFDTLDKGWPGVRTNGEPCKQDVYVYRIDVVDSKNDRHELMGSVTLIR